MVHLKTLAGHIACVVHSQVITDAGLAHLKRFTCFCLLYVVEIRITCAVASRLKAALPSCKLSGPYERLQRFHQWSQNVFHVTAAYPVGNVSTDSDESDRVLLRHAIPGTRGFNDDNRRVVM